ncbi:trehalose 6-phosphate synthase /trehalose 6-phosphatase [Chitinophaga eiseniae]|uniref:Trehalose 6-phosphate synthase /trehalose 6-phosphatase n=1 Tax=Chitinophaga eiseniae TaxID=634771 RepID=A0A1T4SWM1_9BACT|nr:bifunctional alpha,alpha-trehalose-phosphate synthase (UDP-forming)/trehalose-phosphatase [Chitinophaga eiseniae]SKA32603.1 trehalose 6-phosphate synthase /trehalose 6-phosphatase [Chitinophaga eiseniae]
MPNRLIIVSNRLPLAVEINGNTVSSRQASGGLVSAVSAFLGKGGKERFGEVIWAGIPGCDASIWQKLPGRTEEYVFLPIFIEEQLYDEYYNGFSNSLIWPLFHYFPTFVDYNATHFDAYTRVNDHFAQELLNNLNEHDIVWIHDYHLLPLAAILRQRFPSIAIGFFLHIPFPSYELFRVIPKRWQQNILEGLLGADLIGFHTIDYLQHFTSCLETILKIETNGQHIFWKNRTIKIDAFPVSIDFERFNNASDSQAVREIAAEYSNIKGERKMIFSVDRLDYTKGISNRLKGYERFLENNPEYIGNVIFVLTVIPSRDSISRYIERKKMIDEFIGRLNSRFGSIVWQPVIYQYDHLNFEELIALFLTCDVALITPLRDGMNLVAKEFIASRKDGKGVLILSEMAGASKELTEALLINPNDSDEISEMIKKALEMPFQEQKERIYAMQNRIRRYDVVAWATDFLEQLQQIKSVQLEFEIKFLDAPAKLQLIHQYTIAQSRLILLDYDGTLAPFSKVPMDAAPGPEVTNILKVLSESGNNQVYIVSGRDSKTLDSWLGHLPIGLISEHGARIRNIGGPWQSLAAVPLKTDWQENVFTLMDAYVSRCANSFIEQKEYSIAWHYRNANIAESAARSKELHADLLRHTANMPLQVLQGNKVIEVRNKGVNKGVATDLILKSAAYDFVLAIGDDTTDEDMFYEVGQLPDSFTIKVGNEPSFAKYNLHNPATVLSLLQNLVQAAPAGNRLPSKDSR